MVGDVEFEAPNRGLLITAGSPPTIPAGVWAYNGAEWHELAEVCGGAAQEGEGGRIAWAGPGEFWTVSVGRPGQAGESKEFFEPPPLIDNTLCHFSGGALVGSYAHVAFQPDSYQAMRAAACSDATDCWFAGKPLPEPQVGAFQLHWNGGALEAEPYPHEGRAIEDMTSLEGSLIQSVRISSSDPVTTEEVREPPALHRINREGIQPTLQPEEAKLPLYREGELPEALDFLHLSSADGTLWALAAAKPPQLGATGEVTLARRVGGVWSQLVGPGYPPTATPPNPLPALLPAAEERLLLDGPAKDAAVSSIAAEPGTDSAWIALKPREGSGAGLRAVLTRVSGEGKVLETQTLPSATEEEAGVGPKGAAAEVTCPQLNDCWMVTTQGWLFHLAPESERSLERDPRESEYFTGLITNRPEDQGLPQVPPDAPPPDTSGLLEEAPNYGGAFAETKVPAVESKIQAVLLSDVHSRLVHGSTLELRFHLAVKARVRVLAERRKKLVASTPTRTLAAGNRKLLLRLNRREWPTKLDLQTHPLAPLPTTTIKESVGGPEHGGVGTNTVSTGLIVLPQVPTFAELGLRP